EFPEFLIDRAASTRTAAGDDHDTAFDHSPHRHHRFRIAFGRRAPSRSRARGSASRQGNAAGDGHRHHGRGRARGHGDGHRGSDRHRPNATTNASGNYVFSNLKDGVYRVEAELPGFRKTVRENVKVDVNTTVRVDLALQVRNLAEA